MKEILVVGATGTVGSEVVRALLARGVTPRARVRPESTARLPRGVRLIPGTLANRADAERAVDGVESAFFVPPHTPDEGTLGASLLAACRNAGVKRFVFSSAYRPAASNRLSLHAIHWLIGHVGPHYKQRLTLERRVRTVRHIFCSDEWRRSSGALGEYKQDSYARTFGLLQRFGQPTRERDVTMTTELLGRPPRDYTDFVRRTAAAWTEGPSPIRCSSSRDRDMGKEVAFSSSQPPRVVNLSVPLSTTGVSVEGHRL